MITTGPIETIIDSHLAAASAWQAGAVSLNIAEILFE